MKVNFYYQLDGALQSQWNSFWQRCQHAHLQQHLLFGEVERAKGRIPIYAAGEVDGNLVCIGIFSVHPLFFGKSFSLEAICLRGPAFDGITHGKDFLLQIMSRFKALNVGSIRISPYWRFPEAQAVEELLMELGFSPYAPNSPFAGDSNTRTSTGRVDLQRSEDEILASFSKWTRRDIRRIEKFDVDIRPAKTMDEALLAFRSLCHMRHERGLTPMSLGEFSKTFQCILQDQNYGILFNAFSQESFLGTLWLIRGPQIALTAGYAIEPDSCKKLSNSLSIGPPLWWRGIQWAKKKGCSWLDVEGYNENTKTASPLYQIHKFKRKFRPQPLQIISEHVYICCSFTYAIYKGCRFIMRGTRFTRSLPYQLKKRLFSPKDNSDSKPKG